ncbi:hypothetical protein [Streptomyces acidicola]|uniref:hypothetical protein n=1 Tax=Streptomyces acidicola TaxID=2596892 RepID=UPI00381EBA9A
MNIPPCRTIAAEDPRARRDGTPLLRTQARARRRRRRQHQHQHQHQPTDLALTSTTDVPRTDIGLFAA